jgi:diguanylate cyclase (GGDEF)-like protein/PAS domain S-box-containing protein
VKHAGRIVSDPRKTDRRLLAELEAELAERRDGEARLLAELEELRAREASHRELVESLNSIVLRWDGEGRVISLNPYGLEFFGYRSEEIVGRSVIGTIVPDTEISVVSMIEDLLQRPERYLSNENENMRKNGERVWVVWRNRPILDADGRLVEILTTGIDATERKRVEDALRESERRFRELAVRDDLTGLFNTRFLYQSLRDLEQGCKAPGGCFSLIFIDIDRFKSVVDAHGHLNASRAIQEVAATIHAQLELPAYAVAYGGDEFVVVLPGFDRNGSLSMAEKIRRCVERERYLESRELSVELTVSCGVATYPQDAQRVEELLARADDALFAGKQQGRNSVRGSAEPTGECSPRGRSEDSAA